MCQVNLDLRQQDINQQTGKNYQIPIVYITQLLGLCLGIGPATSASTTDGPGHERFEKSGGKQP